MCHLLLSVFLSHPLEHAATAVIIKVNVYIRQRYTVRVKETLKQKVILDGVYLGDTQAISHSRSGSRTTPGTY